MNNDVEITEPNHSADEKQIEKPIQIAETIKAFITKEKRAVSDKDRKIKSELGFVIIPQLQRAAEKAKAAFCNGGAEGRRSVPSFFQDGTLVLSTTKVPHFQAGKSGFRACH